MTRRGRILILLAGTGMLGTAVVTFAQIEGGDRGVPPIDSSANYEVDGIQVDVTGRAAQEARMFGWRLAQRRGWRQLWARANGQPAADAPDLPDGTLDGMVAGISVEDEQIGAHRYIARLGVLFDKGRAGGLLGTHGGGPRSAPMLVIPVMWSGGVAQSFERRTEWQKAWARFRTGGSPVDYVRPVGNGLDPLVLNVAQAGRPGRGWWRRLTEQYGAADVLVPVVRLERRWPGGPVTAHFTAIHGPDGMVVGSFDLIAAHAQDLPHMLDEGVRRIDEIYAAALREGGLIADATMTAEPVAVDVAPADAPVVETSGAEAALPPTPAAPVEAFTLTVDTPDADAETGMLAALRGTPGITTAATTSLALGGVSVMRVQFAGDVAALRAALATRGLSLDDASGVLKLRRGGQ